MGGVDCMRSTGVGGRHMLLTVQDSWFPFPCVFSSNSPQVVGTSLECTLPFECLNGMHAVFEPFSFALHAASRDLWSQWSSFSCSLQHCPHHVKKKKK